MIFAQLNAIKNDIHEKVNGVVYTSGAQTISLLFLIWPRGNTRNMQSQWTGKCYGTWGCWNSEKETLALKC